jgi:hypothetical protein
MEAISNKKGRIGIWGLKRRSKKWHKDLKLALVFGSKQNLRLDCVD